MLHPETKSFFLGTDSAPHPIEVKVPNLKSKPGIFSAPCSIEIYTTIFDEEKSLDNLEKFCSINGPTFYKLPVNVDQIIKDLILPSGSGHFPITNGPSVTGPST